jgi:hypothetical protein
MPNPFPIVSPVAQGPVFDSLDQAAHEVSKDFGKQPSVEQSAALFKRSDGKYQYSNAVTNSDHDNFGMRVQFPQGVTLAGVVHSHPGNDELARYFSPNDLNIANQLKVPSYIRFLKDNSIRKYTPGQTATTYMQGLGTHVSKGDALNLPPSAPDPKLGQQLTNLNAKAQALNTQAAALSQSQGP